MRKVFAVKDGYNRRQVTFLLTGKHGLRERLFFISWFLRDWNKGDTRYGTYDPYTDSWSHKNGNVHVSRNAKESLEIIQSLGFDLFGVDFEYGNICIDRRVFRARVELTVC